MHKVRRRVLIRSVERLLATDDSVHGAVVMWTITARSILMAGAAGMATIAACLLLVELDGSEAVVWSVLVGVAVGALLTRFRVVALTQSGWVLLASSSIRNVATELIERLPDGQRPEKLGGNVVTSDWSIGGEIYSVSKRGEKELERLKARHHE